MATIPKTKWRSDALTSAVEQLRQTRGGRARQVASNHVVSVVVPAARMARPEQPGRVVGATPRVPLIRVLDSFRKLQNPKRRIIGGFFYGSPDDLTTDSPLDEIAVQTAANGTAGEEAGADPAVNNPHAVFSGVASPGSQVLVTIADEVGQPVESRTVYTDAAGNWLAPFGRLSTLDESGLISVEVLPTTWGGSATPSFMTFDFPARKIIEQGEAGRQRDSNFFAAVFEGADLTGGDPTEDDFEAQT